MAKVLIYGAGSIGCHLSQAARRIGHSVTVLDIDVEPLRRMREDIYPMRYGSWDPEIVQVVAGEISLTKGGFDIIMIGTPPDSHMKLAQEAIALEPKILHVEKPLLKPTDDLVEFARMCTEYPSTMVTVGYDHAVAPSFQKFLALIAKGEFGKVITIDGATREHWAGIFKAHPWLEGPHDSYLGYTERGGGAACEHSHALHLVLTVADIAKWGTLDYSCTLDMVHGDKGEKYDQLASFTLKGHNGGVARVIQDVVTKPTEKSVRVQCDAAVLIWRCESGTDIIEVRPTDGEPKEERFTKTRPDDFFYLMQHYQSLLEGTQKYETSPIRVTTGVQAMEIIATGLG